MSSYLSKLASALSTYITYDRVLLDDTDVTGTRGGQIHERYGISRTAGAIVVVRPDGYVGTVAPLDQLTVLDDYFGRFMLSA